MQSLLILGRQPEIGLAEIESLYGSDKLTPLTRQSVLLDIDPCLLTFNRLGGSIRLGKLLTVLETTEWKRIIDFLINSVPEHAKNMPPGKMTLGISVYGFDIKVNEISKSALKIKNTIQSTGKSVRIVPNKEQALNSAQVIHNKLTSPKSWELLIIKSTDKTYIAQTVMVQDIESYAKRDQVRPSRDPRIGMLSPKLAQIIINLASGKLEESALQSICDQPANYVQTPKLNKTVLDPFCGTGVLLQEAMLMGYRVIGSDINQRMVKASQNNLKWLRQHFKTGHEEYSISTADAKLGTWSKFDILASETNLGPPLSEIPLNPQFSNITKDVDNLLSEFLKNIASQTKPGFRLCLAVPAWQITPDSFKYLPLIDQLPNMGYNFVDLKWAKRDHLIYYRPNQIVARQLLILTRK